jgi:hypothetical protein
MPAKFSWIALAAIVVGGASWFAVEAPDLSIPVALPLFPIALIAAGLLKQRPRRQQPASV